MAQPQQLWGPLVWGEEALHKLVFLQDPAPVLGEGQKCAPLAQASLLPLSGVGASWVPCLWGGEGQLGLLTASYQACPCWQGHPHPQVD